MMKSKQILEPETHPQTKRPVHLQQISLSGYRPGRISVAQTKFLKIYNSGCEPSKKDQWIKEMFDAYTQMTRRQQEDVADVCKKHDREKWAHILAGMVHINIRAREERPLIRTTVINADVSGWDINPTYNEMRCKGCSSEGISCEFASQDADLPGCRECLILGRECVGFRRPEPATISSRKQTRRSHDETPATEEQSITETLTSRLRSAKNRINEVKTTPSPNSRATTKRNMLRIPPVTSSSQQEDTHKHRERERISLRLPRTTEAENNIDVPKLKSKRTAIPLDPIPPSDEDNDDERSISMGPPMFNLPVTLTSNGLSLAPGAFQSLSRQPTPAPSFPRTFTAPSLAPAFRSPEPPSKRSRIDLDGRDVRYHTPMPADEPALYHKEDKLIERMEREVERKDRELERKDRELEEMREKLKSEREGWLLLQEALEKDKEETMQKTERAKEVVEMEREKERAAWRGASEAWKKEKEALEKDNENWKLKVDEICVERDKLKADIENMQKENDKDEDHLADIERALQEMRARRKPVKDAASTVGDEQRP
ncbi:uncharacterized protein EV420DRAFT_1080143 [Desarmillaria tabescens]|uniref:Uncharacterized protein n=1 Tax=Armillaria tabescens TaxID=1929756 RepID=A0AA39JJ55_ARMTA|nr:uncharacterized protein EV420DRAFT_1080143 [Desarmillaria tabescens]KAK0442284.1 hypothetical protein EV420DRAFT_1080143 [Desarmillaria tabescens]